MISVADQSVAEANSHQNQLCDMNLLAELEIDVGQ
jgi:hypothetical protein